MAARWSSGRRVGEHPDGEQEDDEGRGPSDQCECGPDVAVRDSYRVDVAEGNRMPVMGAQSPDTNQAVAGEHDVGQLDRLTEAGGDANGVPAAEAAGGDWDGGPHGLEGHAGTEADRQQRDHGKANAHAWNAQTRPGQAQSSGAAGIVAARNGIYHENDRDDADDECHRGCEAVDLLHRDRLDVLEGQGNAFSR